MEIGEYIRTRGKIGKLIRIENDKNDISLKWYVFKSKDEFGIEKELFVNKPYIEKCSKNIIDLIEVGDIIEIQTGLYNKYKIIIEDEDTLISTIESLKNWSLKSIVTKEQFKSVEYEV